MLSDIFRGDKTTSNLRIPYETAPEVVSHIVAAMGKANYGLVAVQMGGELTRELES